MAQRESQRLRGLEAEVEAFQERCFFCLADITLRSLTSPTVRQLHCCEKFVHTRCQNRWQETSTTCAHCTRVIRQPAAQIWNLPEDILNTPHREVAREAINLYQRSETAYRNRVTPEFPFFVNPTTWFDLWEALDAYLSFHATDLPLIISGQVFSDESLHFVHRFRLESMIRADVSFFLLSCHRTRMSFFFIVGDGGQTSEEEKVERFGDFYLKIVGEITEGGFWVCSFGTRVLGRLVERRIVLHPSAINSKSNFLQKTRKSFGGGTFNLREGEHLERYHAFLKEEYYQSSIRRYYALMHRKATNGE
ncbi:hypothetical protein ACROYT_G014481 [Oculina patagonica]